MKIVLVYSFKCNVVKNPVCTGVILGIWESQITFLLLIKLQGCNIVFLRELWNSRKRLLLSLFYRCVVKNIENRKLMNNSLNYNRGKSHCNYTFIDVINRWLSNVTNFHSWGKTPSWPTLLLDRTRRFLQLIDYLLFIRNNQLLDY